MKAIVCEEINRFRTAEPPIPTRSQGEALVRIKRIGICGTDYHAFRGNQPFFTYPRILGHELAGVIEELEEDDSSGFQIGDIVSIIPYLHCGTCIACRNGKTNCCTSIEVMGVHRDGGMQEWITVPLSHLIRTEGLSLDESAVLEPLSIGVHAVRRSGLQSGQTALVIGAGPIGLGVMAFAKHLGAEVIAMDFNDERLEFCRDWAGIPETVNALDHPEERIAELTGGDYPSVVFDATGNRRSMEASFRYTSHGGTLVFVGLVKADITFHDPEFHKRELTLMSSRNADRQDFEKVIETIVSGGIDVQRYITHRAPFSEMIDRFEEWLAPEAKVIKAVVEL